MLIDKEASKYCQTKFLFIYFLFLLNGNKSVVQFKFINSLVKDIRKAQGFPTLYTKDFNGIVFSSHF